MDLTFKKVTSQEDIEAVYDHNIDAFSDSPDFKWNLEEIEGEIEDGWQLNAVYLDEEIIAALFYKVTKEGLLTKNTAIKMHHQGSGFSHQIKDFFEKVARKHKLKRIFHYCRIDNFRMYSLNESHGFEKTDRRLGDQGQVVEWVKEL
jgi:N-acetylglutamate synthase-like GNAT family acetyltransferase